MMPKGKLFKFNRYVKTAHEISLYVMVVMLIWTYAVTAIDSTKLTKELVTLTILSIAVYVVLLITEEILLLVINKKVKKVIVETLKNSMKAQGIYGTLQINSYEHPSCTKRIYNVTIYIPNQGLDKAELEQTLLSLSKEAERMLSQSVVINYEEKLILMEAIG